MLNGGKGRGRRELWRIYTKQTMEEFLIQSWMHRDMQINSLQERLHVRHVQSGLGKKK